MGYLRKTLPHQDVGPSEAGDYRSPGSRASGGTPLDSFTCIHYPGDFHASAAPAPSAIFRKPLERQDVS